MRPIPAWLFQPLDLLIKYPFNRTPETKQPLFKSGFQEDRNHTTIDIFSSLAIAGINQGNEKDVHLFNRFTDLFAVIGGITSAIWMFRSCKNESHSGAIAASFRLAVVKTCDKISPSVVVQRCSLYPLNQ